jgi:hypothetical protein
MGEAEAASVRSMLMIAVGLIAVASLVGLVVWWPGGDPAVDREALGFSDRVNATVTSSETGACAGGGADPAGAPEAGVGPKCMIVTSRVTSGDSEGEMATVDASGEVDSPVARLSTGDEIVLNDAGPDAPDQVRYSFADMQRSAPLALLAAVFAMVVVALGRMRGLRALVGIG